MPPESVGTCWRLTQDLPPGYLQGGIGPEGRLEGEEGLERASGLRGKRFLMSEVPL